MEGLRKVVIKEENCIDMEHSGNGGMPEGRCLYMPKTFFTCDKPRPFFMCPSEEKLTEQLTDLIEEWDRRRGGLSFVEPEGWPCRGKIRRADGYEEPCVRCKDGSERILPRKVTLFTLNHSLMSVVIND